jgi:hypothetical protein
MLGDDILDESGFVTITPLGTVDVTDSSASLSTADIFASIPVKSGIAVIIS